MSKFINAVGKACPIPVLMAKKEIDAGNSSFIILVDNEAAVENLKRLADSSSFILSIEVKDDNFEVSLKSRTEDLGGPDNDRESLAFGDYLGAGNESSNNWAVFVGKDYIGGGSEELGNSLMKMFFYTLCESTKIPRYILLMNSGVKLAVIDDQVVQHLHTLQSKGCEVLVCGTCLKYYDLYSEIKAGRISNMYDISECMHKVAKVVTL